MISLSKKRIIQTWLDFAFGFAHKRCGNKIKVHVSIILRLISLICVSNKSPDFNRNDWFVLKNLKISTLYWFSGVGACHFSD